MPKDQPKPVTEKVILSLYAGAYEAVMLRFPERVAKELGLTPKGRVELFKATNGDIIIRPVIPEPETKEPES